MSPWIEYLLLLVAGTIAGALNVVAGGGSFLTMPVLIFLGLPGTVANGTNRVAILCQNISAVWGFQRHGVIDWKYLLWAAIPATLGAGLGAKASVEMGDKVFENVLAGLMIAVTLWTLWDPLKKSQPAANGHQPRIIPLVLGFFVVGIYGGFVQAGVGFLILAATTMARLDLVRGNAVKVLTILIYTVFALGVYVYEDKVDWTFGGVLAIGNVIGSQIGVRLTVLKGHAWVKTFVTVSVIAAAVMLLVKNLRAS